jgi:branched-chain amino acid transport system permease protein/neutral amino acid transport system permease protein
MEFLQILIFALAYGSIVALGAVGVTLTFGVLRFANFAHGDLMTFGAYLAFSAFTVHQLPMAASVVLAIAVTGLLAVAVDKTLFRRFRRSNPMILLISSFGVGLMIRSAIQLIWGPGTHVYIKGIQLPYRFEGLRVKPDHITIFLGTVLLVLLVHLFLTRTRLGKAMRAMADNPDLARISGINTDQVITVTWIVGAGLAAIAGFFLGLDTRLHPDMGWHFLLPVFAAAILGGVGKPYGAIAGGYIIGIAAEFSTLVISPAYKPAIAFSLMVLVLLLRPRGIFEGA